VPSFRLLAALVLAAGTAVPGVIGGASAQPDAFFAGCAPATDAPTIVVGQVTCLEIPSAALGGTTAFSYYVPPSCAPARHVICPVVYQLHGFGGDYASMLGTGARPSAYTAAVYSGPRQSPHDVKDPWNYADTSKWVARPELSEILVAPDGRTVPGGYGPAAGLDGFWTDWNPRYAQGGSDPRYSTPAPRFESELLDELIPYVDAHFPVGVGRAWQALLGESLGGYGSYAIGLRHPDLFASLGTVSGAMNFLFAPGIDPGVTPETPGVGTPAQLPTVPVPSLGTRVPLSALPGAAQDFAVALLAFGDPVADQEYFRGHMPRDLARNGYAHAGHVQSVDLVGFSNDAIPHNPKDLMNPSGTIGAEAFESIVLPMNVDQRLAFRNTGVTWHYGLHPGTHSGEYWNAWLRGLAVHQYAELEHPVGGAPPPAPTSFDYRSTDPAFAVWGWHFGVQRVDTEFLQLSDVSCHSLTLHGSGQVTVVVPPACHTGRAGLAKFQVNLGPSGPIDPPAGLDGTSVYGRTLTLHLTAV
jgi:hypothetical protein